LLAGSIEDALARSAPGSPAYALHLGYRGWLRLQQGRLEEAADDLTAAIAIAERLPVANDLNRVGMLEALGQVRLAQGRPEEALAIFERMAEAEAAGGRAMRLDFGQRTLRRAEALIALGRCADASPWIDRAAALAVQRTSANHPLRVRIAAARARCEAMGARREADGRTPPGIAAPSPRPAESGIRHGSPQRLSP
jgi:tetratricopeptide (TPR) repeat protein